MVNYLDSDGNRSSTWGVLWDFAAFPQHGDSAACGGGYTKHVPGDRRFRELSPDRFEDRLPAELARFGHGLKTLNAFYTHQFTVSVRVDIAVDAAVACTSHAYDARGWCIFESRISGFVKHDRCLLDLSKLPTYGLANLTGKDAWEKVVRACKAGRLPPLTPSAFEELMRAGVGDGSIKFTANADMEEIVFPRYRDGFLKSFSDATAIVYAGLGWGDAEAAIVAHAITHAHAHGAMADTRFINLSDNQFSSAGFSALAEALTVAPLASLERVNMSGSTESDVSPGVVALKERCAASRIDLMLKMRTLNFDD